MSDQEVHKTRRTRAQRFMRLLKSTVNPKAWAHLIKIVNYYNYTHVAELAQARLGENVSVGPTVSIGNGRNLVLGDRISVGAGSSLWAGNGTARIVIGADTMLAPNVMVTAANYKFNAGAPINKQAMEEADIIIGEDVWIGYGAIILPGTIIGDGAVIGAGAVVRGEIEPRGIIAGAPAGLVGRRFDKSKLETAPVAQAGTANTDVLQLIRGKFPKLSDADMGRPVTDVGIDSFDLMTLRAVLEAETGASIPDRDWASTLRLEDIAKIPALSGQTPAAGAQAAPAFVAQASRSAAVETGPGTSTRRYTINMPQMALSGLSEAWLFKELGDVHWAMITNFLQSPSAGIADDAGDRLYATFTRILLTVEPNLRRFAENDAMTIGSELERYGASFYFGHHKVQSNGATAKAQTMSTFAKYGERGKNTSLIKGTPTLVQPDAIPSLTEFPDFSTQYRTRRSEEPEETLFECDYDLLAPHDINGVGLLYFAAYPTVFDLCIEQFEGKGFLMGHSTVSKDICYFANSEPTETLLFKLHKREQEGDTLRHWASLYRKGDGKRMGEVISVKQIL